MSVLLRAVITTFVACLVLPGCASMQSKDPLTVTVAGIESLPGEGLEMRMNVKLRVQNPNDAPVEYNGVSVQMDVQGKAFANGVAAVSGSVPRFGETVVEVPVTISAFRMVRQAVGLMSGGGIKKLDYAMTGKLNGSGFSTTRFQTKGTFDMPASTAQTPEGSAP